MDRFTSFKAPADEEKGFFSRLFDRLSSSNSPSPPSSKQPAAAPSNPRGASSSSDAPVVRITTPPGAARSPIPEPVFDPRPAHTAPPKHHIIDDSQDDSNFRMKSETALVCYQCDAPFTVLNRRKYCAACGQIFCGKCTRRTESALLNLPKAQSKGMVRVCDYCFDRLSINPSPTSARLRSDNSTSRGPPGSTRHSNQNRHSTHSSGLSILEGSHLDLDASDDDEDLGGPGEEEELLSKTYQRVSLLNLKSLLSTSMTDLDEANNTVNFSSGLGDSKRTLASSNRSSVDKVQGRTSSSDDLNTDNQFLSPSHSPTSKKVKRRSIRFDGDGLTKDGLFSSDSDGPTGLVSGSPRHGGNDLDSDDDQIDAKAHNHDDADTSSDSSDDFNDLGKEQVQEDTFNRWFSRPINATSEEEIDDPLRARNETSNSNGAADGPTLRPSFLQTVTSLAMPPTSISSGRRSMPGDTRKPSQATSNSTAPASAAPDAIRRLHHKSLSRAHFSVDGNIALPTTPEVKHVRVVSHSLLSAFGERSEGGTVSSHESAFRTLSIGHLEHIADLLIDKYGLEKRWKSKMVQFADTAVVSLKLFVKQGDSMDILQYSKVKIIPGGSYDECGYVEGLVFDGDRVKRSMKSSIANARVLLLGCSLEYERREGVLLSIEKVFQQEKEYLTLLIAKLTTTISPTIIFVERNVSLLAQQMLAEKGVCVLQNVKLRTLQVLARLTGATILASTDHASPAALGKCPSFEIASYSGPWGAKSCAIVRGPLQKFGTIVLRGAPKPTLDKVKQVTQFLIYAAYNLVLENHLLYEQTATTMFDASSVMRSKASHIAARARSGTLSNYSDDSSESGSEEPLANSPFTERRLFATADDDGSSQTSQAAPAAEKPKESELTQALENMQACGKSCLISTSWSVAVPREKTAKAMTSRDTVYNVCPSITLPPLHAELKQTCEVRLESGAYDVPAPPGPTLNFSYRSLLVPNEQLCSDPDIPAIPPPSKNMRPSFASQQINHLRKKRIHAFKQFAPQHLIYLHSLYSPAGSVQCLPYTPQIIHYYSSNDMTLGQFLEDFCFNDKSRCRNEECHRPTSEHERCILHADGRINIAVRPFDVNTIFDNPTMAAERPKTPSMASSDPLTGFASSLASSGSLTNDDTSAKNGASTASGKRANSKFDASKILMWAACKNLQRQAPYMVPMSRETWNFSFGKFLELIFYSAHTRCRTCNEPTYRGHVRYFYYNNKVVMFEYEQVKTFDTSIPPMQVALDNEHARKLMHQEIEEVVKLSSTMYEAILAKVVDLEDASTKLDDEEELRSVTLMHRSLEEEKSQFMELVQKERYAVDNVAGTTVFQVTRLRRLFYWNIRRWNDSVSAEEGRVQKKWKAFVVTIKEKEKQDAKDREKIEKDLAQIKRHLNREISDRLSREPTPSIEGSAPPNPSPKSSTAASLAGELSPGSGHSARSTISETTSPRTGGRSRSGSVDASPSPAGDAGSSKTTPSRGRSLSNSAAVSTAPPRASLSPTTAQSSKMPTSPKTTSAKLPPINESSHSSDGSTAHREEDDASDSSPRVAETENAASTSVPFTDDKAEDKFSAAVSIPHDRQVSDPGPSTERLLSPSSGKPSDMMTIPILRPQGSSSQELLFDMIGSPPPSALLVVPQLNFTNHELLKEKAGSPSAPSSGRIEPRAAEPVVLDDASSDHSSISDDPLRGSDSSAPTSLRVSQSRPTSTTIVARPTSSPVPVQPKLASSSDSHPLGLSGSLSREASLPGSINANLSTTLSHSPAGSVSNVRFSGSVPPPNQANLALATSAEPTSRLREAFHMVLPQKKSQIIDAMAEMDVYVFPPHSAHEPAVAVYENEPSSIMAYALMSDHYRDRMLKFEYLPPYFQQQANKPTHVSQSSTQSAPAVSQHASLSMPAAASAPVSVATTPIPLNDPFKSQMIATSLHTSLMEPSASAPNIPSVIVTDGPIPSPCTQHGLLGLAQRSASSTAVPSSPSPELDIRSAASAISSPAVSSATSAPMPTPSSTSNEDSTSIGITTAQNATVTEGDEEGSPRERFIAAPAPVPIAVLEFNTPAAVPSSTANGTVNGASNNAATASIDIDHSASSAPTAAGSAHSSSSSLLSDALHHALQGHDAQPIATITPSASHTSVGSTTSVSASHAAVGANSTNPASQSAPSLSAAAGMASTATASTTPVGPKSISLDANARFEMSPHAEAAHRGLISPEQTHIDLEWKNTPVWGGTQIKMQCKTYFARQFAWLRNLIGLDERVFAQSLARCKPWKARGGKSNSRFARTLDERFILKQVQPIELEGFLAFAPIYFDYFSKVYFQQVPTAICKIVGIFSVTMNRKGKTPVKVDLIVQENLFYGHNISKVFDLKGSLRSRYARPESPNDKDVVYQDENLLEMIYAEPICVSNEAKAMLAMTVWNDTLCLSSLNVMDYSLLVGIDQTNGKLVLGIIDYMRTYTWDKQLETYVKRTGILGAGGSKSKIPTIISPKQYKKRFRVAIWAYFLLIPNLNTKLIYDFIANTAHNPRVSAAITKN